MKPLIIFDTDMDTDCDDAGALAMILEAHKQGLIELLGIVSDSVCEYAAPCCEAISEFYGVNAVVGAIHAKSFSTKESDIKRFENYRSHSEKCADMGSSYNKIFAREIGKTDIDYPSAVSVYRQILANAEDNSITVLCVGMLTAVSEALNSAPDSISNLSGTELFEKKVKKVITMGNPRVVNDFNWGMDGVASENFFSVCPVPIYISADGTDIITGEMLTDTLESDHLLRRAYEIWLKKERCGRSSWDLIASLFAINSATGYISCRQLGNCIYSSDESVLYVEPVRGSQCKSIHINCSVEEMSEILNQCMLGKFACLR